MTGKIGECVSTVPPHVFALLMLNMQKVFKCTRAQTPREIYDMRSEIPPP